MDHPVSHIFDPITNIVGAKGVITGDDKTPFLTEWRKRWTGDAAMIVAPTSTDQVAQIVKLCAKHRIAITPQGGNTGLVGGQIPFGDEILISMKRMRTIHEVSPLNNTMSVDAGVTLGEAQSAANDHDRLFPLSIGSEGTCQIGGVISTNAGGVNVLRYGNTRDLVMGLEVVLPNGEIWNGLNALRKNNTGYDLKQLFIGGEGTLGIVTKAVLKLFPRPAQTLTLITGLNRADDIIPLLSHAQGASGGMVTSFEFMARPCLDLVFKNIPGTRDPMESPYPFYCLIELSAGAGVDIDAMGEAMLAGALEAGLIEDAVIAQSETHAKDFWHIRHSISEAMNGEGKGARHDVSVAIPDIPAFLKAADKVITQIAPGVRPIAFGHVGDGNVHYDVLPPLGAPGDALDAQIGDMEAAIYDLIDTFNGSISAEHGIGQHKRDTLAKRKSPVEMTMMHAIKIALDPHAIMNPGKLLSRDDSKGHSP